MLREKASGFHGKSQGSAPTGDHCMVLSHVICKLVRYGMIGECGYL